MLGEKEDRRTWHFKHLRILLYHFKSGCFFPSSNSERYEFAQPFSKVSIHVMECSDKPKRFIQHKKFLQKIKKESAEAMEFP